MALGIPVETSAQDTAVAAAVRRLVGASNAFSRLKQKLSKGKSASILVISDSTGVGATRWPALLGPALTARHPAISTRIRAWKTGTAGYDAATTLSTGTGSGVVTIHNFAITGSQTYYGLGSLFPKGIARTDPDLVIINHGHNHNPATPSGSRGAFYALLESVLLYHPGVPVAWIRQNPKQDNETMTPIVGWIDDLAATRAVTTIDVWSKFMALGRSTLLYAGDNTHPSDATGSPLFRDTVMEVYDAASPFEGQAGKQSAFAVPVRADANLLANGNFATWTAAPGNPDGWTKFGAGTMMPDKETTILADAGRPYSVKLLGIGGASGILQSVTGAALTAMAGKTVSLAVKRYVLETANTTTVGKVAIVMNSTSGGSTSQEIASYITNQTGWVWWALAGIDIPDDVTSFEVRLYHDNAASPSTSPAHFDQACLTFGQVPRAAR